MTTSRREALAKIGALVAAPCFAAAAAGPVYPRLARGVNLHHLLNWPEARVASEGVDYAWPPFAAARFALSDDDARRYRKIGFDFVRLTVDPAILLASAQTQVQLVYAHVDEILAKLFAADLNVIVDLHPVRQNPRFSPAGLVDATAPEMFAAYLELVERVAVRLVAHPPERVAFELMNEPRLTDPADAPRWQRMLEALHRRARAAAPGLTLVLNGIQWDGAAALPWLDTAAFADDNVIFTFHYYEPHTFTHQGAENDTTRFISALEWPADPANVAQTRQRAEAGIAEASLPPGKPAWFAKRTGQLLDSYQQAGAEAIARDFAAVAHWARGCGLASSQILLGEFGCVRSAGGVALGPSRARWLRAVRSEAERQGFSWSYWAYKGYGGMELEGADGLLDPDVIDALGLAEP